MTSDCHTRYARRSHSGFLNADANDAGSELAVELEVGCDADEPNEDPDAPRAPDEPDDPPVSELPPASELPEWPPPPPHDVEDDEEEEEKPNEEEPGELNPRFGSAPIGPCGVASESTHTSPRMCSTYCAGTPGGLAGWVNTTCSPVAVRVTSPELGVPVPAPPN